MIEASLETAIAANLAAARARIAAAAIRAGRPPSAVRLIAVSKTFGPGHVLAAMAAGQRDFGENRVQEALPKIAACAAASPRWHLIGHLQSNKAREAATAFDWVQTVDRAKLVDALARHRPAAAAPLNVLIQVNIDDEASKHGCRPDEIEALAAAIAARPALRLRGLMAIPAPDPDMGRRRRAFRAMSALFDATAARHPAIDTLSMGMSEDYVEAIEEGATLVRIGSALFGARAKKEAS